MEGAMQATIINTKVIALVIFFIQPAAVYCSSNANELFFILSRGSEPAKVSKQLPQKSSDTFMRLPDRSAGGHLADVSHAGSSNQSKTKLLPDHYENQDMHEIVNEQHTPLKFKATNITGTVKLPRVKFTSLHPAIDLREEMPSLDFTEKSLKDGGF
jgi:hypothetical protein